MDTIWWKTGKLTFYNNGYLNDGKDYENGQWVKSSDGMNPGERLVKFFNDNKLDYKKLPEKYQKILKNN